MLLSQLSEATGSGKAECHQAWALNGMLGLCSSKKANELLPTAKCGASPTSGCALQHPGLGATTLPSTKPSSADTQLTPLGTDTGLLHPRHRSTPKAKDEATTDLLWSQVWFLHCCCRSAFGWSFLRTFSAAKVSPVFLVLRHLCATHPAFSSTPCVPLSMLFHEHQ